MMMTLKPETGVCVCVCVVLSELIWIQSEIVLSCVIEESVIKAYDEFIINPVQFSRILMIMPDAAIHDVS